MTMGSEYEWSHVDGLNFVQRCFLVTVHSRAQIQKEVISDLKRESAFVIKKIYGSLN